MATPVMTSQELASYFREPLCIFDLKATTKREALAEMVEAVCSDRDIRDRGLMPVDLGAAYEAYLRDDVGWSLIGTDHAEPFVLREEVGLTGLDQFV